MTRALFPILVIAGLLGACSKPAPPALPHRGYLWQRAWTPAVTDAVQRASREMDGVVVLGAEIRHQEGIIRPKIDWTLLGNAKSCGLAVRVSPYSGPFSADDETFRTISQGTASLLAEARANGVALAEFQLDFDCAARNLSGYRRWLEALRPMVHPIPFAITTLPAWLDEPGFAALVKEVDHFVLQVHSVPMDRRGAGLCDPASARTWVTRAAKLGRPFHVAFPTYSCLAGYSPQGKLLGVAMDSVQPSWPPGTHLLELSPDARELAGLVRDWNAKRPANLLGLLWYRVPVETDQRNWRWSTLKAVMAGRTPEHRLEVEQSGQNPVDLALVNHGESDLAVAEKITVTWKNGTLVSADALPGWSLQTEPDRAIFTPRPGLRLPPTGRSAIGWLRYDNPTPADIQISHDR